jgi:hypothetical protein
MPRLVADPARCWLEVRTYAEGALSRLAHNLSLRVTDLTGSGDVGESGVADLRIPVTGIHVHGVLRGDSVDLNAPSAFERGEIERRIRRDVFSGSAALHVYIEIGEGQARGFVRWDGGGGPLTFPARVEEQGGLFRCAGRAALSLASVQVKPIVGPLRAFRVSDRIEVLWTIEARPG